MEKVKEDGFDAFIEIGPKLTLLNLCKPLFRNISISYLPTLSETENDNHVFQRTLGSLCLMRYPLNWNGLYPENQCTKVALPNYPFDRKRYWNDDAFQKPDGEGIPHSKEKVFNQIIEAGAEAAAKRNDQ